MDIFSHIFKMVTPRALRQLLLFIALNCLTSAAFIANLCSRLIPEHYKSKTTCTSKTYILKFDLIQIRYKNWQVARYFIDVIEVQIQTAL